MRLGILGGGRAAWAFGSTWRRIGWPIDGVWLRPESESRLPELLEAPRRAIDSFNADLLLLAVSDRAIDQVAALVPSTTAVLFHTSGAMPSVRGGFSLHPLRSLPPVGMPSDLAGALLVFEGAHRDIGEAVAEACGARFAAIAAADKVLYHAGAVFGANYVAALLDIADELVGLDDAREEIAGLAISAVENWRAHRDALRFTGPAARGDVEVVGRHLEALADRPEVAEIYRLLAARILATRK